MKGSWLIMHTIVIGFKWIIIECVTESTRSSFKSLIMIYICLGCFSWIRRLVSCLILLLKRYKQVGFWAMHFHIHISNSNRIIIIIVDIIVIIDNFMWWYNVCSKVNYKIMKAQERLQRQNIDIHIFFFLTSPWFVERKERQICRYSRLLLLHKPIVCWKKGEKDQLKICSSKR